MRELGQAVAWKEIGGENKPNQQHKKKGIGRPHGVVGAKANSCKVVANMEARGGTSRAARAIETRAVAAKDATTDANTP